MIMTAPTRNLALTAHVIASIGWIGALAVFFAHALAGVFSQDEQIVRAVSLAMGITAWFVILPLSLTSLVTGVVLALGTAWGLLRHYWIVFKLLLTAVATIVLMLKLGPISSLADATADATFYSADMTGLRTSVMLHAAGGLLVLLAVAVLAVYKPVGMTPYGVRMKHKGAGTIESEPLTGTPHWVKIFSAVLVILILAVFVMLLGGGHGPGAHH